MLPIGFIHEIVISSVFLNFLQNHFSRLFWYFDPFFVIDFLSLFENFLEFLVIIEFSFFVKYIKSMCWFSCDFYKSSQWQPVEWVESSFFISPEFFRSWWQSETKLFDAYSEDSGWFKMTIFVYKHYDGKHYYCDYYSEKNHTFLIKSKHSSQCINSMVFVKQKTSS